jgi:hypothetical protein
MNRLVIRGGNVKELWLFPDVVLALRWSLFATSFQEYGRPNGLKIAQKQSRDLQSLSVFKRTIYEKTTHSGNLAVGGEIFRRAESCSSRRHIVLCVFYTRHIAVLADVAVQGIEKYTERRIQQTGLRNSRFV